MSIPDINKEISSEVQERIDKRISDLFIQSEHNICKPYVCILCDIFVKPKELQLISTKKLLKHSSILEKNRYSDMSESLKFRTSTDRFTNKTSDSRFGSITKKYIYK